MSATSARKTVPWDPFRTWRTPTSNQRLRSDKHPEIIFKKKRVPASSCREIFVWCVREIDSWLDDSILWILFACQDIPQKTDAPRSPTQMEVLYRITYAEFARIKSEYLSLDDTGRITFCEGCPKYVQTSRKTNFCSVYCLVFLPGRLYLYHWEKQHVHRCSCDRWCLWVSLALLSTFSFATFVAPASTKVEKRKTGWNRV